MADGLCISAGNAPAIMGAAVRWCMELPGGITCALEDYDLGSETTLVTSTAAPGIFSSVMALDESLRLVLRDTAGSSGEGSLAISAKTLIDTARSWHLAGITRPCRLLVIQMTQIPAMSCIVSLRIVEIRKDGRRAHAGDGPLAGISAAILYLAENRSGAFSEAIGHLTQAVMAHVSLSCDPRNVPPRSESLAPWQLRRATGLMQSRLQEGVSPEELANACGLSVSYFSRLFKRSTGVSTHQWLLGQRVEHAKHLLECTGTPIAEIATVCGFADQAHFTRVFSRREDTTPLVWRRFHACGSGVTQGVGVGVGAHS
jgi:AraC-like DNA-binding protein